MNVSPWNPSSRRPPREAARSDAFQAQTLELFGSVYSVARRLSRTAADAEDLTQETYVRALGASGRFEWGTDLKAWLFTILRNVSRNRTRDRARAIVVMDGEAVNRFEGAAACTPETLLLRDADTRELHAALAALPASVRETVWLRDIEELSYAEIARRQQIPVGTVMSRLSRGRELLSRRLSRHRESGRGRG